MCVHVHYLYLYTPVLAGNFSVKVFCQNLFLPPDCKIQKPFHQRFLTTGSAFLLVSFYCSNITSSTQP